MGDSLCHQLIQVPINGKRVPRHDKQKEHFVGYHTHKNHQHSLWRCSPEDDEKSDSIGSALTSHCSSMKTKCNNSVKKQKVIRKVAKIVIIMRIHWKLMIGTTEIFLKKRTALTKFLDESNKSVYAGQMELKWVIKEGVFRDSIIDRTAKWKAEVHYNAVRCGVLLGNHEERRGHKVA